MTKPELDDLIRRCEEWDERRDKAIMATLGQMSYSPPIPDEFIEDFRQIEAQFPGTYANVLRAIKDPDDPWMKDVLQDLYALHRWMAAHDQRK